MKKSPDFKISSNISERYAPLISPTLLSLIQEPSSTRWLACEAHLDNELAALSLSEIYPLNRIAKIHSLTIKENFTGKGIWKPLFTYTQNHLIHEEKMKALEWTYDALSPSAPAIEFILKDLGWPPSTLYLLRFHFEQKTFHPPWARSIPLPSNMHYFPWKELTPQDKETIEYLEAQGRFLPYLSPLKHAEKIHPETSIGLRKNNKLVGWSITHLIDPSTLLYHSLYDQTGYGIHLLIESIHRHQQLPIPNGLFEINLKEIDPTWWHFINKRLLPFATHMEKIKRSFKIFETI